MFTKKNDEQLISEAVAGSERAWLTLVRRYEKRVYNYALRMAGNRDDAADMLQDIMLALYRNLGTFRGEGSFPAWLFRLASFRCTDFLRRRRAFLAAGQDPDDTPDHLDRYQPEAALATASRNREILTRLGALSREQRMVVELKFFQHFTFEEIGSQLGISSNTAKTRLYSALRKMRDVKEVSLAV